MDFIETDDFAIGDTIKITEEKYDYVDGEKLNFAPLTTVAEITRESLDRNGVHWFWLETIESEGKMATKV